MPIYNINDPFTPISEIELNKKYNIKISILFK